MRDGSFGLPAGGAEALPPVEGGATMAQMSVIDGNRGGTACIRRLEGYVGRIVVVDARATQYASDGADLTRVRGDRWLAP